MAMGSIVSKGRWPRWRQVSILVKVGTMFVALALIFAIFLATTSNLTKQLIGTSKAIEQAGTERMRIYKLASLIQQLAPSSENERELIRKEMARFERVVEGLRVGTPQHGSVAALNPMLSVQLQALQDRWVMQLRPTLELALEGDPTASGVKAYLVQLDDFVAGWDRFVQSMEQQSAGRLQSLYTWQTWFLVLFFGLMGAALIFLDRVVREPLRQLTAGADRLAAGELHTEIQTRSDDELGQLARTFKRMAETIEQKIGELNALHATGQEIGLLGSGSLDDVLRRIADRAAESLDADIAVVLVRHPTMECWLMETASGTAFDRLRKEILLFEETPFSNQAFETKQPVVVADLAAHKDKPIRFRDEFGAQSYMAVPLLGPHECPGVLVLLSITHQRIFSERDVQMAQQFASYAAVTMENARFFDAIESESQDLREHLREVERKVAELTHEVKAPAGRVAEFASWIERDYGPQLGTKGLQYIAWIKNEGKDLAALAERTLD
ncbi:MAG TPA: GAF domain-containing protein, partial [Nitrospira sp.]|nr:GAF domain-containing protein [Nitrospira sp.]